MNPRKMEQMMKQMGIDMTELDAEEVIIRTEDEELVFTDADVTRMDAQGQQTYQVVGDPETRERGSADAGVEGAPHDAGSEGATEEATERADAGAIPDSDVQIVAQRTGASEDEAREALDAEDGDLAAAVNRLEE